MLPETAAVMLAFAKIGVIFSPVFLAMEASLLPYVFVHQVQPLSSQAQA